jgi:hypothetical protein
MFMNLVKPVVRLSPTFVLFLCLGLATFTSVPQITYASSCLDALNRINEKDSDLYREPPGILDLAKFAELSLRERNREEVFGDLNLDLGTPRLTTPVRSIYSMHHATRPEFSNFSGQHVEYSIDPNTGLYRLAAIGDTLIAGSARVTFRQSRRTQDSEVEQQLFVSLLTNFEYSETARTVVRQPLIAEFKSDHPQFQSLLTIFKLLKSGSISEYTAMGILYGAFKNGKAVELTRTLNPNLRALQFEMEFIQDPS